MATDSEQLRLSQDIEFLLARLRGRIRLYVWLEGLAVALGWLGLAFWLSLAVDQPWFFEPPRPVRAAVLVLVGMTLLFLLVWLIGRRAFVPLQRGSLALLLERRFRGLGDSLMTAVELTDDQSHAAGFSRPMLAQTCELARQGTAEVDVDKVFNFGPLGRSLTVAALLASSVGVFALASPQAFSIWGRRCLLLSNELWPRKTELVVDGFQDGVAKIARGSDFELVVRANTEKVVPRVVQVRYRSDEGFRERKNLSRDGLARPGVDPFQRFSHTFQGLLTSIRLDVVGGDDRKRDLRIEVVDSPTLADLRLACQFPAYMGRDPQELPVSGPMQVPEGTVVTVRARANKDLAQVEVRTPVAGSDRAGEGGAAEDGSTVESAEAPPQVITLPAAGDRRGFDLPLGDLRADRSLLFSLLDTDGIASREPVRLAVGVTPDQPPEVTLQLRGIGSAITPLARIPMAGQMTDDYGLAAAWFEYSLDEQATPSRLSLSQPTGGRTTLAFGEKDDVALDVRDDLRDGMGGKLALKPGQKLTLAVRAADAYALSQLPHTGASPRFQLDVVTPDQLRTMLESRELGLRQRFESIISEMTESSETLAGLEFNPPASGEATTQPPAEVTPTAEPGDEDQGGPLSADAAAELVRLRVERVAQNGSKNAQETLGVALAFDEIHDELVNNRVDTEELKSRLKEGISQPLRRIAEEMFPVLEERLQSLQGVVKDPQAAPPARAAVRDAAQRQVDAILVEMRQVLGKMLELETFNEALALLRSILDSQEKLNSRTEEIRKQKALELLEQP